MALQQAIFFVYCCKGTFKETSKPQQLSCTTVLKYSSRFYLEVLGFAFNKTKHCTYWKSHSDTFSFCKKV